MDLMNLFRRRTLPPASQSRVLLASLGGEISVRGGSLDVRFPDSRIAFFQGTGRWAVAVVRTVR